MILGFDCDNFELDEFDIVRNDINGCLYYNNLTVSNPSLIILKLKYNRIKKNLNQNTIQIHF